MKTIAATKLVRYTLAVLLCVFGISVNVSAQFPGCPNINAGADQTLPCSTPCTNLTATPFHTGATNTYAVSSIPHAPPIPYNQAGGNAISVGDDDVWSDGITLPFNFCFYGTNYTTCVVGSNGSIKFGTALAGGYQSYTNPGNLPNTNPLPQRGDIFGVFHDIDPTVNGSVRWYLLGTSPCRIFVVIFENMGHYSCTSLRSTHMMVLYETTNAIDVYVEQKQTCTGWQAGYGIIGIQNPTGTAGIAAPGRNATPAWTVTTPEGWRFTPNGTPNYSVQWFQGATLLGNGNTINVCPTGTTTYTSVVTYNRCDGTVVTDQDQVTVNFSNLPPPTVTPTAESCNNYNNGSVVINNAPGAGPYTVNITGPATGSVVEANTAAATANFTNLPDGNYSYSVTGANGCTVTGTFTIAAGPNCCSVTATGSNVACNGATTGSATANPVGLGPFTYSWTGGQTSQTAVNLGSGAYTVTMTDAAGCVANANVNLTQPTLLNGTMVAVNVTCNGLCNGSITVTASGGTPPYQYSIDGGAFQGGNAFTGLCNGNHTITIRDANNCTRILNQNITQPAPLALVQGTLTPTTCGANNGTATVTASGGTTPYTYTIDGGASQASNSFTGLAAGTHNVVVTDNRGCTQSITITIVSTNAPTGSIISQNGVSCFGGVNGSVVVGISGGTSPFSYNIGGPNQASNTFTNVPAGTYTAHITDANGCTANVPFTITSPPQLTYTTVVTPVSCNGACNGQIQVNATGGTTPYQYSINNGVTYAPANPITGLCAGSVNLVVQDANGCLSNSTVNITQPAVLTATFASVSPTCNGACNGQITVTPAGGSPAFQYSVNGGPLQGSNVITGICGGNSTILVQDSHGCQFSSVQNVAEPPAISLAPTNIVEANCGFNNGSITVAGSGPGAPFQFSFEGGPFSTNATFSNLLGGAYEITVQSSLGCQETIFVGINDIEMDGIVLVQEDATCFGVSNGSMEVTNVSGAPPITYELDNSGVTQTGGLFPNLPIGSHVVTIYDGGFCVFTLPFMVGQPTEVQYTTSTVPVACNGGNTGEIHFTSATGGTGAHQFSIDNGATFQASPDFTGLAAGTYNVQVMDANNCMVSGTVTIGQSPALAISTSVFDLACFNDNSGVLQIGVTGGTPNYDYSIDNGATFVAGESFFSLAAGTYNIVVEDNAGCQATTTATINQPAVLTATYATTPATCNGVCDGEIAVTATGGTTPYLYSPDNGTTFFPLSTLTGLCAGNINVLVQDDHNCTVASVQVITEPTPLTLNVTPTNETCSASNGQIAIVGGGGIINYTYSIDNGATYSGTPNFNGLPAATYGVFIMDANGCLENTSTTIDNESSPVIIGALVEDVSCNAACDGSVDVNVSGGTGTISYSIGTPQASNVITGICAGNYTLTVEDDNGCTDTQPVTITEPAVLTATVTPTDLQCFEDNSGEIAFAAAGGTTPYTYSIDNGATSSPQTSFDFLSAGTYNTIVTDDHGCTVTTSVTINEPAELTVQNINVTNASCFGFCDGDAGIVIAGGTTPYDYTWSNGDAGTNAATALCAGTYDVTVEDDHGCSLTEQFNVTQPPMLVITSSSATDALCNGDCNGTISINSALGTGYSIDNGATFQPSNNFTALCAATYPIVVQDQFGCTQTASLTVNQPTPLVLAAIPEDGLLICYDGFGTLSGSATGGTGPYYYIWDTGDTTQYLNVNLTSPATFTCTVTDQNGCVSNAQSANVTVRPEFIASVTNTVSACPGQPVTMTGSGVDGLPGYFYEWLTPTTFDTLANGASYSYTPTASETVLMVARDMCYRYDTLPVTVQIYNVPEPLFSSDPELGCSPLAANFNFDASMSASVASANWIFGDGSTGSGTSNVPHIYTEVGCYDVTVEITTTEGCVSEATINNVACVAPDPVADFTWNPTLPTNINSNVIFTDQSENADQWSWNFGEYGNSTQQNPQVQFGDIEPGTYTMCLSVVSPEGCVDQICKPIQFVEEFLIYVPNTFTPDGDEYNNEFKPVVPPGMLVDEYLFTVFDRWGEILFESYDINTGWDGTYHDNAVKDGTYVWRIVVKGGGDKKLFKYEGHVNLLR